MVASEKLWSNPLSSSMVCYSMADDRAGKEMDRGTSPHPKIILHRMGQIDGGGWWYPLARPEGPPRRRSAAGGRQAPGT